MVWILVYWAGAGTWWAAGIAFAVGYTNASWTLKCDLVTENFCRMLNYMDSHGYRQFTPRDPDPSQPREPLIDLKSGYVHRAIDKFPKQGSTTPWRLHQNYARDIVMLRRAPLDDGTMEFSKAPTAESSRAVAAAG